MSSSDSSTDGGEAPERSETDAVGTAVSEVGKRLAGGTRRLATWVGGKTRKIGAYYGTMAVGLTTAAVGAPSVAALGAGRVVKNAGLALAARGSPTHDLSDDPDGVAEFALRGDLALDRTLGDDGPTVDPEDRPWNGARDAVRAARHDAPLVPLRSAAVGVGAAVSAVGEAGERVGRAGFEGSRLLAEFSADMWSEVEGGPSPREGTVTDRIRAAGRRATNALLVGDPDPDPRVRGEDTATTETREAPPVDDLSTDGSVVDDEVAPAVEAGDETAERSAAVDHDRDPADEGRPPEW